MITLRYTRKINNRREYQTIPEKVKFLDFFERKFVEFCIRKILKKKSN